MCKIVDKAYRHVGFVVWMTLSVAIGLLYGCAGRGSDAISDDLGFMDASVQETGPADTSVDTYVDDAGPPDAPPCQGVGLLGAQDVAMCSNGCYTTVDGGVATLVGGGHLANQEGVRAPNLGVAGLLHARTIRSPEAKLLGVSLCA
jgi:hypothetical protein